MSVQRFRKKPVVIEAIRYSGSARNLMNILDFCGDNIIEKDPNDTIRVLRVKTLDGDLIVQDGDYIIKGVKGEFYPCRPDIFEATYDLVGD